MSGLGRESESLPRRGSGAQASMTTQGSSLLTGIKGIADERTRDAMAEYLEGTKETLKVALDALDLESEEGSRLVEAPFGLPPMHESKVKILKLLARYAEIHGVHGVVNPAQLQSCALAYHRLRTAEDRVAEVAKDIEKARQEAEEISRQRLELYNKIVDEGGEAPDDGFDADEFSGKKMPTAPFVLLNPMDTVIKKHKLIIDAEKHAAAMSTAFSRELSTAGLTGRDIAHHNRNKAKHMASVLDTIMKLATTHGIVLTANGKLSEENDLRKAKSQWSAADADDIEWDEADEEVG